MHLWLLPRRSLKFSRERAERRRKILRESVLAALVAEKLSCGEPLTPELVDFHLSRNYLEAQDRYQPRPYAGSLVLFRASQATPQYLATGKRLGWQACIHGDIRVTAVDSTHLSLLAMPGVAQVVEGLKKELARLGDIGDTGEAPASPAPPRGTKRSIGTLLHALSAYFKRQAAP